MDKKIFALTAVAILLVAGISAVFLLMDNDEETPETVHLGRLPVFGNADNNDYLDDKDVSLIEKIIKVNSDDDTTNDINWRSEYPYADADDNGVIDSKDVELAKKIAKREITSIKYLDATDTVEDVKYPINYVVGTGSVILDALVYIGATEKVVGIHGSKKWVDSDLWVDINDKPRISSGSGRADFELVSNLENKDAIFCNAFKLKGNSEDFEKAGIDVVSLNIGNDKEISGYLLMGLMLQKEERSHELAAFYDDMYEIRDKAVEKYKDRGTQTALAIYMEKQVYSDAGKYGTITDSMCMENIWHYNAAKDAADHVSAVDGKEWLSNPEWQADWIVGQEKWMYKDDSDPVRTWNLYTDYYSSVKCFPEKCVIVNENMVEPLKIAYLLEYIYPGVVEEGFGDKMHQQFIDRFVDSLSGNYDVTKRGTFVLSYDLIKDRL